MYQFGYIILNTASELSHNNLDVVQCCTYIQKEFLPLEESVSFTTIDICPSDVSLNLKPNTTHKKSSQRWQHRPYYTDRSHHCPPDAKLITNTLSLIPTPTPSITTATSPITPRYQSRRRQGREPQLLNLPNSIFTSSYVHLT